MCSLKKGVLWPWATVRGQQRMLQLPGLVDLNTIESLVILFLKNTEKFRNLNVLYHAARKAVNSKFTEVAVSHDIA